MKYKIYWILIIILLVFIISGILVIIQKTKQYEEEIAVSAQPVIENVIEENKKIKNKEIASSTSDWNLILVNKHNPIPDNYTVEVSTIEEKWKIDARIKDSAIKMLTDARKQGLTPVICSAYREPEYQKKLFNNKIKEYKRNGFSQNEAIEQASLWVTIPGTSEHEIGLSLDIVSSKYQILDEKQENTDVQKWLMEHCHEYGFILRYPTDKKDITKINYEPWHYRYVGTENATFMKEKGYCLEEYIEYLKSFES